MTLSRLFSVALTRVRRVALEIEVDLLRWGIQQTRRKVWLLRQELRDLPQQPQEAEAMPRPVNLDDIAREMRHMTLAMDGPLLGCGNPDCENCQTGETARRAPLN